MTVRILKTGDEAPLENFLKDHAPTSMFLRSNMRQVGFGYKDAVYHGDYYGAVDESGAIKGVLAHYWNNNVMVQAPDNAILSALFTHFRDHATRPIGGVIGPDDQVLATIDGLAIPEAAFALNRDEGLYDLDLDDLKMPANYDKARHKVALAREAGQELLTAWLTAYNIEALGSDDDDILKERIKGDVKHTMENENRWVLLVDGTPVALCGFNAQLPDIVQIGPVWTPPEHRSNGYARIVLVLSLAQAKERGVKSSVLFTDNPPAVKAYESIGYEKNGSFRLSLLKAPMPMSQKATL